MTGTFTAVIDAAEEGGYWAWCPKLAGANGQEKPPKKQNGVSLRRFE